MIVVVEPAVAYGETNMYKNNTYRVREGVVNLTMINPTPIASVYDIVYSIRSAIAPKDDPVSFVTEGLTPAIKCRHGKVAMQHSAAPRIPQYKQTIIKKSSSQ